MTPLFVSFFTLGTPYETEAAELAATLRAFDLPYDIEGIEPRGSWVRNCSQKARFVRDMMLRHPEQRIVWLDADARVKKLPTLFQNLECDVAFHRRHGELLSGTLFFAPTSAAWETVRLWESACEAHPDEWDQRVLDDVVKENKAGATFGTLPASYVQIFDAKDMGDVDEAVILHTQASRRLRGLVGAS